MPEEPVAKVMSLHWAGQNRENQDRQKVHLLKLTCQQHRTASSLSLHGDEWQKIWVDLFIYYILHLSRKKNQERRTAVLPATTTTTTKRERERERERRERTLRKTIHMHLGICKFVSGCCQCNFLYHALANALLSFTMRQGCKQEPSTSASAPC